MRKKNLMFVSILMYIFMIMSINNIFAEVIEGDLTITTSTTLGPEALSVGVNPKNINTGWNLKIDDLSIAGNPYYFKFTNVEVDYVGVWGDIPSGVGAPFEIGTSGVNGTGGFYIFKTSTSGRADVWLVFDDNFNVNEGNSYPISVYTDYMSNYYTKIHASSYDVTRTQWHLDEFGMAFIFGTAEPVGCDDGSSGNAYLKTSGVFINEYTLDINGQMGTIDIIREDIEGATLTSSKFIYKNSSLYKLYESSFSTSNETHFPVLDPIGGYFYIEPYADGGARLIYSNIEVPPESTETLLYTDKTTYNLSETINLSWENVDLYYDEHKGTGYKYDKPYTVYILYDSEKPGQDYEAKYSLYLYNDLRDETIELDTSFLAPQNEYFLAIVGQNGFFGNDDDLLITSDKFYVYDDDEYITTSCNADIGCYTTNGATIKIFYNVNNNSDIIVKDNNGDIVQTFHNRIGSASINYITPDDDDEIYAYPNWKIYMNNTEYETSFVTNVTVYWSLLGEYQTPPTPTPYIPDQNVTEQIKNLKTSVKPLKDLVFGLATIFVDNPDYNNDNIITENEMNNWFASLLSIGLVLMLIVFYIGLTKRG